MLEGSLVLFVVLDVFFLVYHVFFFFFFFSVMISCRKCHLDLSQTDAQMSQ